MQLMHNGKGLYCLYTPFSEKAKRTLFNLPTQEKNLLSNLKSKEKKAPSGSAPRPPEEDGPKWPPVTGL